MAATSSLAAAVGKRQGALGSDEDVSDDDVDATLGEPRPKSVGPRDPKLPTFESLANTEVQVWISSFEIVENDGKHVVYNVRVDGGEELYVVSHRYSDFHALHGKLCAAFTKKEAPFLDHFPPKKTFGNFNEAFLEKRRGLLEKYMQEMMKHPSAPACAEVAAFLTPPPSTMWMMPKKDPSGRDDWPPGAVPGGALDFLLDAGTEANPKRVYALDKKGREFDFVSTHFFSHLPDDACYHIVDVVVHRFDELTERFLAASRYGHLRLCYHGTSQQNIEAIARDGFMFTGKVDCGFYGKGFYQTHYPEYSCHYINVKKTKRREDGIRRLAKGQEATIVGSMVWLGNTLKVEDMSWLGKDHDPAYNSHYVTVGYREEGDAGSDFFPVPDGTPDTVDEVVVFDRDQLCPRYAITYAYRGKKWCRSQRVIWLDSAMSPENQMLVDRFSKWGFTMTPVVSPDEAIDAVSSSLAVAGPMCKIVVSGALKDVFIPRCASISPMMSDAVKKAFVFCSNIQYHAAWVEKRNIIWNSDIRCSNTYGALYSFLSEEFEDN